MKQDYLHIKTLESENEELRQKLYESNSIIEAIKEGSVDALILNKDGKPHVYSIQSADYTYRILIEKFGEGALSINYDGLILYCNNYFSKLIGLPANKIVGTYFNQYVASSGLLSTLIDNVKDGPVKNELLLIVGDRKIHAYISMSDLKPNVAAIGVVVTDLTEKRRNEEALEKYQQKLELKITELNHSNVNLEQFIHVISHDLKEPIRKLLTYTSFMTDRPNADFSESDKKSLQIINSSAVRLNSLVDDLVKYSYTAVKEEPTKVNLNKVFSEVTEDLELSINENNATIICSALPVINGSKVQMRQLISNLLANAIKYKHQDRNPVITITTQISEESFDEHTKKKFHHIVFSDNGIGMEEAHLSKIFTIFQRLHMRNEYSGNGIGLSICKKIMENHSGRIEVSSVHGKGSKFNLYFPL